jgi:hypothetical protein
VRNSGNTEGGKERERQNTHSLLRRVEGRAKAALTLLIHLGARRDTVDRHVHELLRLDNVKQLFNVLEYLGHHLVVREHNARIHLVRVRAIVNDTVHVQVQTVCARGRKHENTQWSTLSALRRSIATADSNRSADAKERTKLGLVDILLDFLVDERVSLGQPAIELGNAHVDVVTRARWCSEEKGVGFPSIGFAPFRRLAGFGNLRVHKQVRARDEC